MKRQEWLSQEFERQRPHLRAVAYRMLGSMSEADDAVQEAWVRLDRHDPGGTDDLRGWLTVVVGRICLDMLRSRRSRREDYAGSWLPEPIVSGAVDDSPERDAVLADSVGLALLVVLETLTPAERLAFVLHDVFAVPFDEIAEVAGQDARRGPAAGEPRAPPGPRRHAEPRRRPRRSSAASSTRSWRRLARATSRARPRPRPRRRLPDRRRRHRSRSPARRSSGPPRSPRSSCAAGRRSPGSPGPPSSTAPPAPSIRAPHQPTIVAGFTVVDGRIAAIDLIADPAKLGGLPS